ncbi:MAG: glucosamine-6-phosphate deaminase [Phycisphaerae bacterium]|nr:glucosamine-6-phosphate deaminase [Phycisphaerae bacterium]
MSAVLKNRPHVETPQTPASATLVEKIPTTVYSSSAQASRAVAYEIADLIRQKQDHGEPAVLGLATGSTPVGVYRELIRIHREEGLSFRNVTTFNLDEYYPMPPTELQSYRRFMNEQLFDHIDIDKSRTHVPDGTLPVEEVIQHCHEYERKIREAGGIDLQILGIGRSGHIGFNEPGSTRESRTRLIMLDALTRNDAAGDFFGIMNVPRRAITMGVDTILGARRVILLAFGEHKAAIIKRAVEGDVSSAVPASFLQLHPAAKVVLDTAAAGELTRFKTPWLIGPLEEFGLRWDKTQTRRAVVWAAQTARKPLLKLTDEDYNNLGLGELIAQRGGAYDVNIEVFKAMQNTITGWPGGKRPDQKGEPQPVKHSSDAFPKRVLIFSPHPDDDVISMGGTFMRLCEQGHDVHVAYQTSGNIAVFDDAALRHADFAAEFCREFHLLGEGQANKIEDAIERFIRHKKPQDVDPIELLKIKALIRRSEARAGARFAGVREENIHFLDMPFYETGRVRKKPMSEEDIRIVSDLIRELRPHQIYAAGDLADPHGTHRVCLEAIIEALTRLKDEPWMRECDLWLYRGAWHEWSVEEIEMAVPLSPDELIRKRLAILKHESQRVAMFAGNDTREFWQRAEDRNRGTARAYDELGLPQYEAIEGFVRWKPPWM